jgi:hypothetical protein
MKKCLWKKNRMTTEPKELEAEDKWLAGSWDGRREIYRYRKKIWSSWEDVQPSPARYKLEEKFKGMVGRYRDKTCCG